VAVTPPAVTAHWTRWPRNARVTRSVRPRDAAIAALAGMPVQLARALLARGAARRRAGRRTEAREDLQRAHDLASGRGAVRIAEAAADELRSSGLRLRRAPARGADALTPSERRVAELAATGLSNRDIAQSLFLSEKTVEAHLGRAYKKLGIRSRGRLAAALGGGRRPA
jgi:DNA-binding NarL/FixJ family response regulator